jgi:uncharacterized membrane protein
VKRNLLVVSVVGVCALASIDAGAKVTIVNSSPRVLLTAPAATRGPVADAASRENWVGTRAIVRDVKTGKLRKPTATETRDMVKSIKQLTARVSVRTESSVPQGGVMEAAPAQVVIARATEDGGMETLCVQTFDEAAEFLGLVKQSDENNQQ